MKTKLDASEINVLIEALDAWVNEDGLSGILGGLLSVGLSDDKDAARERLERRMQEVGDEKAIKDETAILIKAKLISMKRDSDRAFVDGLTLDND